MDQNKPTFLEKLKMSPSQLWAEHRTFLIVAGVLILIIKFQDVILDYLVNSSKELVKDTKKQSDTLQDQENKANNLANQLIKEVQNLDKNKPKVDENWNKK